MGTWNWIEQYNASTPKTKAFALTWIIYTLALIVTTAYCYGRLDFVRSYRSQAAIDANKHEKEQFQQKEQSKQLQNPPQPEELPQNPVPAPQSTK